VPIVGDLSDDKFREKIVSTVLKKEKKIDYLFNNAGFGRSAFWKIKVQMKLGICLRLMLALMPI
jgi:short-subunit dehydrogenase